MQTSCIAHRSSCCHSQDIDHAASALPTSHTNHSLSGFSEQACIYQLKARTRDSLQGCCPSSRRCLGAHSAYITLCAAWIKASGDCCLQAACPQLQSAHQIPKADASSTLSGGYIDLVGVSAAYSGALKAATHHVEDASSDTALAKALAEKADLERQLKVWHFCLQTRVLMPCVKKFQRQT